MEKTTALRSHRFYDNRLYTLLANGLSYSDELLQQINFLLHEQPDLAEIIHPKQGSLFHTVCRNSNGQEK